jgi:hypothetical protein
MPNRPSSPSLFAIPPSTMLSDPLVQSHHETRVQMVQSGVGQTHTYQGSGGGRCSGEMPFNPLHGAHSVSDMTVYPLHPGGPHSFHPGHNVRRRPSLCYVHLL